MTLKIALKTLKKKKIIIWDFSHPSWAEGLLTTITENSLDFSI